MDRLCGIPDEKHLRLFLPLFGLFLNGNPSSRITIVSTIGFYHTLSQLHKDEPQKSSVSGKTCLTVLQGCEYL